MVKDPASTWSTVADVATTVGTVVALIGVIITAVLTLRSERTTRIGQELEREQAEATAARSEAAARLSDANSRRIIDALETMATATAAGVGAADVSEVGPSRVRWKLDWSSGDTYQLTNSGLATARAVQIESHPSLYITSNDPRDLRMGEALQFMAAPSLATSDLTITVRWLDEADREESWSYPLPPTRR